MKSNVEKKVEELIKTYQTKNIYYFYDVFNIKILYCNFKDKKKGNIFVYKGIFFVSLNVNLSINEKKNVLIHELGHYILHRNILLNQKM